MLPKLALLVSLLTLHQKAQDGSAIETSQDMSSSTLLRKKEEEPCVNKICVWEDWELQQPKLLNELYNNTYAHKNQSGADSNRHLVPVHLKQLAKVGQKPQKHPKLKIICFGLLL